MHLFDRIGAPFHLAPLLDGRKRDAQQQKRGRLSRPGGGA